MARVVSIGFETTANTDGIVEIPRGVAQLLDLRAGDTVEMSLLSEGRRGEFSTTIGAGLTVDLTGATGAADQLLVSADAPMTVTVWRPEGPDRPAVRDPWTANEFDAEVVRRKGPEVAARAREIREWAERRNLRLWWGRGREWGGWIPVVDSPTGSVQLFELWVNGVVEMHFQYMKKGRAFADVEKREELRRRLNQIEGINIRPDGLEKRPSLPIPINDARFQQLLDVFDWIVDELEQTGQVNPSASAHQDVAPAVDGD